MIIILGSGISGLMAALACADTGNDFVILTDSDIKPKAKGFQYLHDSCGLNLKKYDLKEQIIPYYEDEAFRKMIYSSKVYGNLYTPNSMDKVIYQTSNSLIYSMDEAVDILWERFYYKININYVNGLKGIEIISRTCDKVISTIPMYHLIEDVQYSEAWLLTTKVPDNQINYVVYDLNVSSPIYRFGTMFGNLFFESHAHMDIIGMQPIALKKVITYEKLPEIKNVIFAGRYGRWDKSILSHDVYYNIKGILNG